PDADAHMGVQRGSLQSRIHPILALRVGPRLGQGSLSDDRHRGDAVLWTDVHLDGEIQHHPINASSESAFRVMIPLKADSFLYGPDRTTFLTPEGTGVGLEYDLFTNTG